MADYGKGPSKEEWARHSEIMNTGFRGWDVYQRLPVIMKAEIPWLREFAFGFSVYEDMSDWTSRGWRPMRIDHFGKDGLKNFNETIGLRFNLESLDGTIKFKNSYIMIKPMEMRDEQMKKQNESFEEYYSKISRQSYVHPNDPRADEMAKKSTAVLEEERHQGPAPKRGNINSED